MGWGVCERVLKPHLSRKGLRGKAKAKTGIGKSDLPGLQGGPRKRDSVSYDPVRAPRLYPDPEEPIPLGNSTTFASRGTAFVARCPFVALSVLGGGGTGASNSPTSADR